MSPNYNNLITSLKRFSSLLSHGSRFYPSVIPKNLFHYSLGSTLLQNFNWSVTSRPVLLCSLQVASYTSSLKDITWVLPPNSLPYDFSIHDLSILGFLETYSLISWTCVSIHSNFRKVVKNYICQVELSS